MKKLLYLPLLIFAFSCNKKEESAPTSKVDSTAIIDSINTARTKINDSIRSTNHFQTLEGNPSFTHDMISGKGKLVFKKLKDNRDQYSVKGELRNGKNYLTFDGKATRISDTFFNFTGKIEQSIQENDNGKPYIREGSKTFQTKDGGKTWKLQDKPNPSGFVDNIIIYF